MSKASEQAFHLLFNRYPSKGEASPGYILEATLRSFIDNLIDKRLDVSTGELLFRTHYETIYGIHNHQIHPGETLAAVELHECERVYDKHSPYRMKLRLYIDNQVKKITGLSFKDFMSLPRHEVTMILEECNEETLKSNKKIDELSKELDEQIHD